MQQCQAVVSDRNALYDSDAECPQIGSRTADSQALLVALDELSRCFWTNGSNSLYLVRLKNVGVT